MPTRPNRYHHGDLRAALLARAEETLREKGPTALSLRELARDLGVSHAAPSRHFKDKQALLDALALNGFERLRETTTACLAPVDETFATRLGAAARAYVDFAMSNAALLDLMFSVKHSPQASQALRDAAGSWADQMATLIEDGQRRGEVRQGPPETVAMPAFATLHGYAVLAASGMMPPATVDNGLDDVIAHTLRACAPEKAVT